jgi:outer membrane protein OmpA-like peptidoglycan-associated protein
MWRRIVVGVCCAAAASTAAAQTTAPSTVSPTPPKVALVAGMRLGWAWRGDSVEGDYTPTMFVSKIDPTGVTIITHASKDGKGGKKEDDLFDTRMLPSAMADGRIYRQVWISTDPLVMQGTTSMVLSAAVMHDITTKGSAALTIVDDESALGGAPAGAMASLMRALGSDSAATGTPFAGTMTRAEPGTIPFVVLVNDKPVTLPAIHLRGVLTHDGTRYPSDMQVLADPAFPLVLAHEKGGKARNGREQGGRIVSITLPDSGAEKRLENDLAAKRPVEIYDIYFDYNSAAIKPESDSVLRELGSIMQRHPDWKLRVTGHTDSIGGSGTGNQVLSARRAAAVKDALASRYGVAAIRLDTGGAGDSQPLETNATLEGRARNRRVELTRE